MGRRSGCNKPFLGWMVANPELRLHFSSPRPLLAQTFTTLCGSPRRAGAGLVVIWGLPGTALGREGATIGEAWRGGVRSSDETYSSPEHAAAAGEIIA